MAARLHRVEEPQPGRLEEQGVDPHLACARDRRLARGQLLAVEGERVDGARLPLLAEHQRHRVGDAAQLLEARGVEIARHHHRHLVRDAVLCAHLGELAQHLADLLGSQRVHLRLLRVTRQVRRHDHHAPRGEGAETQQAHERDAVLVRLLRHGIVPVHVLLDHRRAQLEDVPLPREAAPVMAGRARPLRPHGVVAERLQPRLEEVVKMVALHEREHVGVERRDALHETLLAHVPREDVSIHGLDFGDLHVSQNATHVVWPAHIEVLAVGSTFDVLFADGLPPFRRELDAIKEPRLSVVPEIAGQNVVLRSGSVRRVTCGERRVACGEWRVACSERRVACGVRRATYQGSRAN